MNKTRFILLLTMLLIFSFGLALAQSQSDQGPDVREESTVEVPDLADIIPLTTKLSGRLAVLENQIADLLDVSAVQDGYTEVESSLKDLTGKAQRLKETKDYRYRKLVDLREAIEERK